MSTLPLGTLSKIRMGVTLRGRDATRPDPQGSCRLIQIGDLADDGTFRTHDFCRIEPRETIKESFFLQPGDVLFPNRGLRTTASVFRSEDPRTFVGAQFYVIQVKSSSGLLPEYLAWLLRTSTASQYFSTHRKGTLVKTLQLGDLQNFPVSLPPLNLQHRIVELDHLQREAQQLETSLSTLRQTHLELSLLKAAGQP